MEPSELLKTLHDLIVESNPRKVDTFLLGNDISKYSPCVFRLLVTTNPEYKIAKSVFRSIRGIILEPEAILELVTDKPALFQGAVKALKFEYDTEAVLEKVLSFPDVPIVEKYLEILEMSAVEINDHREMIISVLGNLDNLKVFEFFFGKFKSKKIFTVNCLHTICQFEAPQICKFLCDRIQRSELRIEKLVNTLASSGNLTNFKCLHKYYKFTRKDFDAPALYLYLVKHSGCESFAEYVDQQFEITKEDFSLTDRDIVDILHPLYRTKNVGHANFLVEKLGISQEQAIACSLGADLETLKNVFQTNNIGQKHKTRDLLLRTIFTGAVEIVEYVFQTLEVTRDDIEAENHELLVLAARSSSTDVLVFVGSFLRTDGSCSSEVSDSD